MTPSGSRTPLLLLCTYWARGDVKGPPEDPSEFSEYGTATHTVAELLVLGKTPDLPALATEHHLSEYDRDQCLIDGQALADWVRENVSGPVETEQAYAFDTETFTARKLMTNGHRDYSDKKESEYCGTLDLISVSGSEAVVVDYKTGVTPAESYREQLEFGALVVTLTNPGVKRVRCVVLKVSDGQCYPLQWEVDTSDIDDVGMSIQLAFRQIPNAEPTPGRHCWEKYCPLRGSCPATVEPVMSILKARHPEELGTVSPADVTTDVEIKDLAQAQRLYDLRKRAGAFVDVLDKSLRRFSDGMGGMPVGPGVVWGADEGSREYLTLTPDADRVIKEELGDRARMVTASISKSSLKKAAGSKLERVLDALRKCGAAKPSAFVSYKERKVG